MLQLPHGRHRRKEAQTCPQTPIWPLLKWSRGTQTIFPSLDVPAWPAQHIKGRLKSCYRDRCHWAAGRHFPLPPGRSAQSCRSSHPLRVLTTRIKMYRQCQIALLTILRFKISRHFQQVLTSDGKKEQTKRSSLSFVLRYILYQSIKEINIPIINLAYSPYRGDG